MMDTRTRKVQTGWEYSIYRGCDEDENGEAAPSTADKVIGGWAPTRQKAHEKMQEALL